MLFAVIKFKEVFRRFRDREPHYECCPKVEDWEKVEKICEILENFNSITKIISKSDYPTANLFLNEIYRVKVLLNKDVNLDTPFCLRSTFFIYIYIYFIFISLFLFFILFIAFILFSFYFGFFLINLNPLQ